MTFYLEGTLEPQILQIRVEDKGPGFPDGLLSEEGRPKVILGTGLSTASHLMDDLKVESVSGQGATVLLEKTVSNVPAGAGGARHAGTGRPTGEAQTDRSSGGTAAAKPGTGKNPRSVETRNAKLRETQEEANRLARPVLGTLTITPPVGYLTMNGEERIVETNVTLAEMLRSPAPPCETARFPSSSWTKTGISTSV